MNELNIEFLYSIKDICDFFDKNRDLINDGKIKIIETKYNDFEVGKGMIVKYTKPKEKKEMTIEEAILIFKEWVKRDSEMQNADRLENIEVYNMAIKSFEAWDKVKDDIRQMYFTKPITVRNEVLDIINKHLEEIENDS